jgi:hypothetical protein
VTGAAESGLAMANSAAQSAPAPAQSSARRAPPGCELTLLIAPPLEIDFGIGYAVDVRLGMRGGNSATLDAKRCVFFEMR